MDLSILYITRKYPPMKGGMEETSYQLSQSLAELAHLKIVSWGGSQRWLPVVLAYLFLKATWLLITEKFDVIHTGMLCYRL